MKKLKIIQIVGDGTMTGAPRHVLFLSNELKRRGHKVLIIAPPGPIIKLFKKAHLPAKEIVMKSPLDRRADHKIRDEIIKFNPDIVHCHGTRGGWLGRLAARKVKNCAIVYTEHLWTKDYHIGNPVWHEFQLTGLKYMDKFTDATIAVSRSVRDFLTKSKIVPKGKVFLVPNVLDPQFATVARYNKPEGVMKVIGSVGSLNGQKGYLFLIEALGELARRKIKNWRCQIIGSGPLEKIMRRKIRKYKLIDKVTIITKVDDICETMRHFSIYIQNSATESFGMAVMEAMALGIPPIVTNRGALPEIVDNDVSGIIIPYGKPDKIASAIIKLIEDPKLYQRISRQARAKIIGKYSPTSVTQRIEKIYIRAIKNKQFKKNIN